MSQTVPVNGLTLTLKDYEKLKTSIAAADIATGPLVHMSTPEEGDNEYTVTVLAYVPSGKTLNPIPQANRTGLSLNGNKLYLNYVGPINVESFDKADGSFTQKVCRDFLVEFNCDEDAVSFDLHYIQFTYSVNEGTNSVDAILVRDLNDDPRTSRGTIANPSNP